MRLRRVLPLVCLLLAASSRSAFADGTLFLGTVTKPASHSTRGFAVGAGFLVVGVEFEFASTTGGGGYRERLGESHQETNVVFNTGGGAKVSVVGPLKVRFDYRVLKLQGSPLFSTLHRLYAGLNLSF
jgi:opacity protein-like surface antigen